MALGNHEFDNTLDVLEMQSELADFPMLAANILYQRWRHSYWWTPFSPYKVFTINGLKVAVIGLTTSKDTAKLINPDNVAIHFADPQVEIKKAIKEIEANETVDLILLPLAGHYANGQHGGKRLVMCYWHALWRRSARCNYRRALSKSSLYGRQRICWLQPREMIVNRISKRYLYRTAHEWGRSMLR